MQLNGFGAVLDSMARAMSINVSDVDLPREILLGRVFATHYSSIELEFARGPRHCGVFFRRGNSVKRRRVRPNRAHRLRDGRRDTIRSEYSPQERHANLSTLLILFLVF